MATKKNKPKPAKKSSKGKSSSAKIAMVSNMSNATALITNNIAVAVPANVGITFFSGTGQITASLFRNGILINLQTIVNDGSINFSDVQSGDGISVNGVATGVGGATITIDRPTSPSNPDHFDTGFIHRGYIVL